jgi:hypothetical protein
MDGIGALAGAAASILGSATVIGTDFGTEIVAALFSDIFSSSAFFKAS